MIEVALRYIAFLTLLGQNPDPKVCLDEYRDLFAENVIKIENGSVILTTHIELERQLTEAHKAAFPFTIVKNDISCDEKDRKATVCFTWTSEKLNTYITTVILKIDEDKKIKEILEVFTKYNGTGVSTVKENPTSALEQVAGLDVYPSTKAEQEALDNRLGDFNFAQVPPTQKDPEVDLSLCLKEDGKVVAGINACMYAWYIVYVHILFIEESHRGKDLGSFLLKKVETEAKAKGAKLIHLDTFDFQAKDFYLKHGYEIFGTLDDCPPGHKRYYLKKAL